MRPLRLSGQAEPYLPCSAANGARHHHSRRAALSRLRPNAVDHRHGTAEVDVIMAAGTFGRARRATYRQDRSATAIRSRGLVAGWRPSNPPAVRPERLRSLRRAVADAHRRPRSANHLVPDIVHVATVLAPFALLPLAGWIGGRRSAGLLALIPAALVAYFAYVFDRVQALGPFTAGVPWAPGLGLSLSFHFDGLSLFFATLIAAVGALIVLYASRYIDEGGGRFQVFLFAFMGSMLGLVLSDNLVSLFVFWELTGFTSYLLIGFAHDRQESRQAAMQALLVTAGGGLALLAASVLIGLAAGEPLRTAGERNHLDDPSVVRRDHRTRPARGVHEVRAVPLPLLAAERDAGADTCQRLSALGHHGEGGGVPGGPHDAAPR